MNKNVTRTDKFKPSSSFSDIYLDYNWFFKHISQNITIEKYLELRDNFKYWTIHFVSCDDKSIYNRLPSGEKKNRVKKYLLGMPAKRFVLYRYGNAFIHDFPKARNITAKVMSQFSHMFTSTRVPWSLINLTCLEINRNTYVIIFSVIFFSFHQSIDCSRRLRVKLFWDFGLCSDCLNGLLIRNIFKNVPLAKGGYLVIYVGERGLAWLQNRWTIGLKYFDYFLQLYLMCLILFQELINVLGGGWA